MPQAFIPVAPGIFRWADTCNVYAIKDGSAAILIDLGDGSVLDALPQIGVSEVEWVSSVRLTHGLLVRTPCPARAYAQ